MVIRMMFVVSTRTCVLFAFLLSLCLWWYATGWTGNWAGVYDCSGISCQWWWTGWFYLSVSCVTRCRVLRWVITVYVSQELTWEKKHCESWWWLSILSHYNLIYNRDVHGPKNAKTNHSPAQFRVTRPATAKQWRHIWYYWHYCCVLLVLGKFHNWISITTFCSCTVDLHYTTSLAVSRQ